MSLQNDFCSLCGVGKSQMNILQFEIMTKINQMFKQILCISSSINHSKYICSDCELSVQHFYKFWQMVQKVHKSISFIQHGEKSTNSLFPRLPIEHDDDDDEGGLNLCHTTGITEDSEPVLIKINVVKQFQCHVCKMGLCFSQLLALHQVTHGLGTVACQCEQCGHQDDIGLFLQDKNNVHCPKCSFRKLNQVLNSSVDVQTQFNTEPEKSMDNQFQCVWCGQVYKHKMNLKSHLLNNHNKSSMLKTKFYCNICDKYFISTSRLNMHSKIHLSVKEFQCPICKKSFNQKNNLNIHLKKHCPPKRL
uniref:Zinc finger protein 768 n=1 Tax=Cacopsylla melanoneura TaxID=428564 RepID=A0A8D8YRX0_9HEMI